MIKIRVGGIDLIWIISVADSTSGPKDTNMLGSNNAEEQEWVNSWIFYSDRRQKIGPRKLELVKKFDKTSSGPILSEQLMMFD